MRIVTKGELIWDGERYHIGRTEGFEYEGPIAEAKGGDKQNTNTVTQEVPPYLQGGHESLIRQANQLGLLNEDFSADIDPLQRQALAYMRENVGKIPGIVDQNFAPGQRALGYLLDPGNLNIASNPQTASYLDAATRGVEQQFTQNVLPNIRSDAVSSGMYGGSRQGVGEGIATQGFLQSVGDTRAKLSSDLYGRQLGGLIAGTQMAPTYTNQALALSDAQAQYAANAGTYAQGLAQQDISEPYRRLEWLRGFYPGGAGGVTTSRGPVPYTNPWLGAAGGAATGAAIGSSLYPSVSASAAAATGAEAGSGGGWWGAGIGALLGYLASQ